MARPTGKRLDIGQYRMTVTVTGDDVGPLMMVWMAQFNPAALAAYTITVDDIEPIGPSLARADRRPPIACYCRREPGGHLLEPGLCHQGEIAPLDEGVSDADH